MCRQGVLIDNISRQYDSRRCGTNITKLLFFVEQYILQATGLRQIKQMLPHCESVQSALWFHMTGIRRLRVSVSRTASGCNSIVFFDAVLRHLVWAVEVMDACVHLALEYTYSSTVGVKAAHARCANGMPDRGWHLQQIRLCAAQALS
jgi:hypothetical protein